MRDKFLACHLNKSEFKRKEGRICEKETLLHLPIGMLIFSDAAPFIKFRTIY